MKNIKQLSIDLSRASNEVIGKLVEAQRETAEHIWEHLSENANMDTGKFIASIEISETEANDKHIKTFIGSDLMVTSKEGKSYNLGQLLETGTNPHIIRPVDADYLVFEKDGKKIFAKEVFHPGMKPYNNYKNALNANISEYKKNISKAIKESL